MGTKKSIKVVFGDKIPALTKKYKQKDTISKHEWGPRKIFLIMSAKCLHVIKLINLQNNDIITHQLLLLKGKVENFNCFKNQEVDLFVDNTSILSIGLCKDTGRFKFLLNLGTKNRNLELKFKYCTIEKVVNILYKRKESIYKLQPLLILAKDEEERCDEVRLNQKIIDLNLLLVQSVYANKLKEIINERLHFVFNGECKIFNTRLKREEIFKLGEQQLWLQVAKELLETNLGKTEELKFIAFINCTKYLGNEVRKSQDFSYKNIRKHIKGHAALGTGGLALFSTIYFYSWPKEFKDILNCFLNAQNINMSIEPDESNYRKTKGGVYASSLGAVCHEIGHIFDLGHDLQGVMGSNFDYINKVFTLQTKTENLPDRLVEYKAETENKQQTNASFTCLRDPSKGFLQRYREQLENDSFYFSSNSAVILSHHAWLRNDTEEFRRNTFDVELDTNLGIIKSLNVPLKIIEIRASDNSLVKEWFHLQKSQQQPEVFEFNLKNVKSFVNKDYYIFVMSIYGHAKKLEIS